MSHREHRLDKDDIVGGGRYLDSLNKWPRTHGFYSHSSYERHHHYYH